MSVMYFKEQLVISVSCDMLGAVHPTTMSIGHIQVHTKLNLTVWPTGQDATQEYHQ